MNEQELANVIWDIKEIIRNLYDDSEVEDVILPFTLMRRLDCVLDPYRDAIMEEFKGLNSSMDKYKLRIINNKYGLLFYNDSGLSLEKMLAAPDEIGQSFETYLNGFSDNVKNILANFVHTEDVGAVTNLTPLYSRLDKHNKLLSIVHKFVSKTDLHPDKVSNAMMGTVFEIIIRRAKESSNTKAGQFYTPRDIVRLLVSLTLSGHEKDLFTPGKMFSIYDPCCGTGGMLTTGKEYLLEKSGNEKLKVNLFGQELNEKTYAICRSDLMIKGDKSSQIKQGNTFSEDQFAGRTFKYMLANPPFGVDWGTDEHVKKMVEMDNCKGGRFEAGLPSSNDGSLLFLQHMISKMDPNGSRIGIVLNGSPLFNGSAGSGWSNIRKMLLDRNLLDAVIALPQDMFYGTNISTYLWILDNNRPESHSNKLLLINAAHDEYVNLLKKNLGKKRNEISDDGLDDILQMYENYVSASRDIICEDTNKMEHIKVAKVVDYDDLLYTNVTIERPLRLWFENINDKYTELLKDKKFKPEQKKNQILKNVLNFEGVDEKRSDAEFFNFLKEHKVKLNKTHITSLRKEFGNISEDAPVVYEKPGMSNTSLLPDINLRDTENIPMKEDINEYFKCEVLPFVPDAWMDRKKDKVGCEIPFNRMFYIYRPQRSTQEILFDLEKLDKEVEKELERLRED